MALARALSVALTGMEAHVVEVEVDVGNGLPHFVLTALSDRVLKQVEHRLRSAIGNSGERWPQRKTTVALSPASVPKAGSGFDLPIAVAMLAADERLPADRLRAMVMIGELSLNGAVKPVNGVLPAVIGAVRAGRTQFVVPRRNLHEARLVPGIDVVGVGSLTEICAWLRGECPDLDCRQEPLPASPAPDDGRDYADVLGQDLGRRAMEVAAAGGHHVLLHGPPGVGKTMLAERLPGILPDLTDEEALEVTAIHSVAGRLPAGRPLVSRPPYCAPHHSSSLASIVGGGTGIAVPGAISLAHRGVLFIDEAPEFDRRVLDALRQPLESGEVTLARAAGVATYPARFLLVLAANPCPCSAADRDPDDHSCTCSSVTRRHYQARLSGPFRDRVDLSVRLPPVTRSVLVEGLRGESSARVRERVAEARGRAAARLAGNRWQAWADVPGPVLRRQWPLPAAALAPAHQELDRRTVSTRGFDRLLKIAWTLADLEGIDVPGPAQVAEALELRGGRRTWPSLARPA